MILGKHFVIQALTHAIFYLEKNEIKPDANWQAWETGKEVNVSFDSRTVQPGDFFIALKGPSFDGHNFVAQALAKGACGALIHKKLADCVPLKDQTLIDEKLFIVVPDTLKAFVDLAKAWRKTLTCPVIGITGSIGKTSTKEMLRSIVQQAGLDTYVSFKNYNNIFGLCYNILRIPAKSKAVILEVGINEKGEMQELADILRPTIGLITCIAHSHLAGFNNSMHVLAEEKRRLFTYFTPQDIGIVFGDQPQLTNLCYPHPVSRFGFRAKNYVQARKITIIAHPDGTLRTQFLLKWYGNRAPVSLKTNHAGFVQNALAASTVAYFLHIPFAKVVQGLEKYEGVESRFELKKLTSGKGIIFDDCYNANPESMKAALQAFAQVPQKGIKVAILGDMLELGNKEIYWHRHIGRFISKYIEIDRIILVGALSQSMTRTLPENIGVDVVNNWEEAKKQLDIILSGQDAMVLVKASHGMHLQKLVDAVTS